MHQKKTQEAEYTRNELAHMRGLYLFYSFPITIGKSCMERTDRNLCIIRRLGCNIDVEIMGCTMYPGYIEPSYLSAM